MDFEIFYHGTKLGADSPEVFGQPAITHTYHGFFFLNPQISFKLLLNNTNISCIDQIEVFGSK
jgi:hypothetical protein